MKPLETMLLVGDWFIENVPIKILLLSCLYIAPLKFSSGLSPKDLVAWLSQEFIARSLTLDEALKERLLGKFKPCIRLGMYSVII
jgi:hypothetical protein